MSAPVPIDAAIGPDAAAAITRDWVETHVPPAWRHAADAGGVDAIRRVRTRDEYERWYPTFGDSGLVVPTWPPECGGLGVDAPVARAIEQVLAPYHLGRLNPLGLNLCAPALFAHGTDAQRRRFLPPMVRNTERWCQLFSEPGAGSDLASLATRAERDGDEWVVTGQKVWTTWAHHSDYAVLLARTDPTVPKRRGITYFLVDLHQPGVEVRPLRHLTGDVDFNEVYLDQARIPGDQLVGTVGGGWRVANATLSSERQMVAGAGSGGVDRIGGSGVDYSLALAGRRGAASAPVVRQRLAALVAEERIRAWTNARARAARAARRVPGSESSVGKIHSAELNQRLQLLATDLLGPDAAARDAGTVPYPAGLAREVHGMLRSRANSIEGGTSEVNRTIVGERVLGLPREPDPWHDRSWSEVPRS